MIESDELDVEALAYARAADGFLTALNAVAPPEDGALRVATFNPGSNVDQTSLLRLVNASEKDAEATVTGVDDAGLSPGEPVLLELPAGSACTVDAAGGRVRRAPDRHEPLVEPGGAPDEPLRQVRGGRGGDLSGRPRRKRRARAAAIGCRPDRWNAWRSRGARRVRIGFVGRPMPNRLLDQMGDADGNGYSY